MKLSEVLRQWRWAAKIDLRSAAKMIGTSAATLSRFERGENCDGRTLANILKWLLSEESTKPSKEAEGK